jgi:hypothetical protein
MTASTTDTLPPLPYERAPQGDEDTYRLTRDVAFRWSNPPAWVVRSFAGGRFDCAEGCLRPARDPDGAPALVLTARRHFCFAVSVAPSFPRALAAACAHDFIYKYADSIGASFYCPCSKVLHVADHWFLAQMRASGFLLARTYFCAVRIFGYAFRTLSQKD